MRIFSKSFLLFVVILATAWQTSQAQVRTTIIKSSEIRKINGKDYFIHTVQEGHTVYSISGVYNIPVDEICYENPEAKNGLKIGQILYIPLEGRDKQISKDLRDRDFNFIFHVVKEGETLYGIGNIYEVLVDTLMQANPEAADGLKPGQYLKIPVKSQAKEDDQGDLPVMEEKSRKMIEHVMQYKETLFGVSKKYSVSIEELKIVNPGLSDTINTGEVIYIPYRDTIEDAVKDTVGFTEHIVKSKETLYSIALHYMVSIDSIRQINPGLWVNIYAGQIIKIPTTYKGQDYITHRVQKRTKLKKIARMYSLKIDKIREINPEVKNKVQRGEILKIPVEPGKDIPFEIVDVMYLSPEIDRLVDLDSIRCNKQDDFTDRIYKVALMLPLYLDEFDSIQWIGPAGIRPAFEYKPFNFIQFYEGVMLAVDSLKGKGLKVELYVYDFDEKINKTIRVLQNPELTEMDLIIGPLFRKSFKLVSNFAEMFGIRIVNPLTTRTEILGYKNVFKIKPSYEAQHKLIDRLIKKNYPDARVIIVRHNKYKNGEMVNMLKERLERDFNDKIRIANSLLENIIDEYSLADTTLAAGELLESINIENILIYRDFIKNELDDSTTFLNRVDEIIYMEDGIDGLMNAASIIRPNVIVAVTDNKVFALELLTKLNELRDTFDITLIGIPEWDKFSDLETEYLMNLNTHFLSSSCIDYQDENVKGFIKVFRRTFKTEPQQYAYDGFDIAYYFLNAMMKYGDHFEKCLPFYHSDLIQSNFKFLLYNHSGFENQYWNVYRFENYTIRKLN